MSKLLVEVERPLDLCRAEQLDEALKAVRERDAARAAAGLPPMADPRELPDPETRLRSLNVGIESGDPRECSALLAIEE